MYMFSKDVDTLHHSARDKKDNQFIILENTLKSYFKKHQMFIPQTGRLLNLNTCDDRVPVIIRTEIISSLNQYGRKELASKSNLITQQGFDVYYRQNQQKVDRWIIEIFKIFLDSYKFKWVAFSPSNDVDYENFFYYYIENGEPYNRQFYTKSLESEILMTTKKYV